MTKSVPAQAIDQGVHRPLELITGMTAVVRRQLAALLAVDLTPAKDDVLQQAWLVINTDLKGLQARSHGPDRQLLPLRNHNWWEILLAASRKLDLEVYPGLSERDVECIVFEHTAARVARGLGTDERAELETVARDVPAFTDAVGRLGLSADGRDFVFSALHRIAAAQPGADPLQEPPARTAAFLRQGLERAGIMPSISRSLRFLRDALGAITVAWSAMDAGRKMLPRSHRVLLLALAVIHVHALLEQGREDVEALRL